MSTPQIIFLIALMPLLALTVWLMRKDKRFGLIALGVLLLFIIKQLLHIF